LSRVGESGGRRAWVTISTKMASWAPRYLGPASFGGKLYKTINY
jgi:hypothetical protein